MLRSQLQVLLVALSSSVLLARVSSTPHRHIRTELLRPDTTQENEDLTRLLLLKLMADPVTVGENEVLTSIEEELGLREEVTRRQLPLSQRERKAGCRNFFWKTFTSC
ncbi:somatostatin-1 [Hypomesus transpacificus]|uniref:somatostatin-1 n=1 Tax=Hypomesus transpacificus TaxID=137520 RepID=UPI001F073EA9|nr:somatostatin-1 [Hypomesus transpacificus]